MNKKINRFFGILVGLTMILGLPAAAFAANDGGYWNGETYIGKEPYRVTIDQDCSGVYGKLDYDNDVSNARVSINNCSVRQAIGGSSLNANSNYNKVEVTGGTTVVLIGGSGGGAANANEVIISGGTINGWVCGGYADRDSSSYNTVTLSGGTVNEYIAGGQSVSGNATNNTVTVSGGTVGSDVRGGTSNSGNATNNTVVLNKNYYIGGDVCGGVLFGTETGTETKDCIKGNTLIVKGKGSVNGVRNFEALDFDLPEDIAGGDTVLTVQQPVDLKDMSVSVAFAGTVPRHKEGDKITLINNVQNTPKSVSEDQEYDINVSDNKLILTWLKSSVEPTLAFTSDNHGDIDDWTFRGNADCDQKITNADVSAIYEAMLETPGTDKESQRKARNADANADGTINTADVMTVYGLLGGTVPLPDQTDGNALTFEVKDIPKDGYEISLITVNGQILDIPAKGKIATTEANGVTYTVTIDANGKGSVSGKYLVENKVAFEHTPVITPKGDEDPEKKDDPKTPKEEEFNKMVNNLDNDGDLAGSTFGLLKARGVSKGKKKILLKWTDPKLGAAKYVVYGNQCNTKGKKYKYVKLKEFNANTFKYVPSDILGKKLKKGTYYKFLVTAVDKNGRVVAISKTVHVTTKGKRGNDKAVKRVKPTKKAKYTLNAGKTKKLKVKEVKGKKRVARHRVVSWESSNPNVVVVSKKGKVTAKGAGTCTIYAYAQNGVYTTFKITVK